MRVVVRKSSEGRQFEVVSYGFAETRLGKVILGFLDEKDHPICYLHFVEKSENNSMEELQQLWPKAHLKKNTEDAQRFTDHIFGKEESTISVVLAGTPFQQQVWEALVDIKAGTTCTYGDVAEMIGNPKAVRAVANAVMNNNLSVLVPCHRVVSKSGNRFKYRWGASRKRSLLEEEGATV